MFYILQHVFLGKKPRATAIFRVYMHFHPFVYDQQLEGNTTVAAPYTIGPTTGPPIYQFTYGGFPIMHDFSNVHLSRVKFPWFD